MPNSEKVRSSRETREHRQNINQRVAELAHGQHFTTARPRVEHIRGEPALVNDPGLVARFSEDRRRCGRAVEAVSEQMNDARLDEWLAGRRR